MTGIIIGVGLIAYSNIYEPLLKALHVKISIKNAVAYILLGFLVAGILLYANYDTLTKGSLIVLILCAIGSIVRIGYGYFKNKVASDV